MLIEIANHTTREVFRSKNGFTLLGDNGLILGYVQTDEGEHVVEIERLHIQQAVLSHFKSREDAIKFMCTFEDELPRLHTVYDKLHTHTGVGAFRVFNPITSYPFHVGLDSDTHLHFGNIDVGKTTVSYAEKDADVTRDYFMQTMNSVLHELVHSKIQGLGYPSLPFLPTMTSEEKLSLLQDYIKHNTAGAVASKPEVDPNKPIIQPSDTPYDFADIHEIIKNSTYHPPKCPFGSNNLGTHKVFITDPHLSDIFLGGTDGSNVDCQKKNNYKHLTGEQLHAFVKQIAAFGSATKAFLAENLEHEQDVASTGSNGINGATVTRENVPKQHNTQTSDEKQDRKPAERKHRESGRSSRKGGNREHKFSKGNKGARPKSPYTSHRRNKK